MRPTRRFSAPPKPAAPPPPSFAEAYWSALSSGDQVYAQRLLDRATGVPTRPVAPPPPVTKPVAPKLPGPVLWTAPPTDTFNTKDETSMNDYQREKLELQRAMLHLPGDMEMRHPRTGRPTTVSAFLAEEMNGGPGAVVHIPSNRGQAQPSVPGPVTTPRQSSIDQLPQHLYDEAVANGGHIDGVTRPVENAYVQTRTGGAMRTHVVWDAEAGRAVAVATPSGTEHE